MKNLAKTLSLSPAVALILLFHITSARYVLLYVPDDSMNPSNYNSDSYISRTVPNMFSPDLTGDNSYMPVNTDSYVSPSRTYPDSFGQVVQGQQQSDPRDYFLGSWHKVQTRSQADLSHGAYDTSYSQLQYPYSGWKPY